MMAKKISSGFMVVSKNKILLGRTTSESKEGRCWGVFKGGVENGESILEAACRELLEEAGIDIMENEYLKSNISKKPVLEYSMKKGKKFVYLFLLSDPDEKIISSECHCKYINGKKEFFDYKWFDKEEAQKCIFKSQIGALDFIS